MKKLKAIIQAFTGYAGSSENPEKVSARFVGIMMGFVSQFAPIISSVFSIDAQAFAIQAQPLILVFAVLMWSFGAVKAMWLAAKNSETLGGYMR